MCVSRNLSSAGKASFDGAAASAGCLTHTAFVISRLPVADGWYFLQIKAGKFPRKFRHPETDLMTTLEAQNQEIDGDADQDEEDEGMGAADIS